MTRQDTRLGKHQAHQGTRSMPCLLHAHHRSNPHFRGGFTLIEVGVCVVIVGLVAAIATVSLASLRDAAKLDDVAARIERFDQLTRQHAVMHGETVAMVFDLQSQSLQRFVDEGERPLMNAVQLPQAVILTTVHEATSNERHTREALLVVSPDGCSPTYAVELQDHRGRALGLMTAGMTGQWTRFDNPQAMEATLAAYATARHDVD